MTTHYRDVTLFNSKGISYPVCYSKAPYSETKAALPSTADKSAVDCGRCRKVMNSNGGKGR